MNTYKQTIERGGIFYGTATYSDASGKIEMVGWQPARPIYSDIKALRKMLSRLFKPNEIIKSDYANGYIIRLDGDPYSLLTVYLSGKPGLYSLFRAVPDHMKGKDIEDEMEICVMVPLEALEDNIKGFMHRWVYGPVEPL